MIFRLFIYSFCLFIHFVYLFVVFFKFLLFRKILHYMCNIYFLIYDKYILYKS